MPARLLYTNRAQAPATVLSVSSEQGGSPRSWLKDESRGLKWRSLVGWNPHALLNDQLTFLDNGVARTAQLTVGNYSTPTAFAAHVTARLNSVAVTNTYLCSYNSGTSKYTIARATGAGTFGLPFATGAAVAAGRSCHLDLGFASTDVTGATTYTAGNVSYKSREWITVDLGSALAVTAGVVIEHNLGSGGTITQQGHSADTAAGWAAPTVSDVLAGDATIRLAYRSSNAQRYWRLLVDDVQSNTAGYTEIGIWYVGDHAEPSVGWSVEFTKTPVPLSTIVQAISGATRRDERPARWVYEMSWLEVPEADRAKLAAWVAAAPIGKPSFLAFDPTNAPTSCEYGYFSDGVPQQMSGNLYWTVPLVFQAELP